RAHARPQSEIREGAAAWRRLPEPSDDTRPIVLDDEDAGAHGCRLEESMKRDRALIADPEALGELREDAADGRLGARAEHHAERAAARHEDATGDGLALDRRSEGDGAVSVHR